MGRVLTTDDFPWMSENKGRWYRTELVNTGNGLTVAKSDIEGMSVINNFLFMPQGYLVHDVHMNVRCTSGDSVRTFGLPIVSSSGKLQGAQLISTAGAVSMILSCTVYMYTTHNSEDIT